MNGWKGNLERNARTNSWGNRRQYPISLLLRGTRRKAGMRPFGDPFGGGYLLNIGHVIWGSSNDVFTTTVSVNPADGGDRSANEFAREPRFTPRGRSPRPNSGAGYPPYGVNQGGHQNHSRLKRKIRSLRSILVGELHPVKHVLTGKRLMPRFAKWKRQRRPRWQIMQIGLAKARAVIVKLGGDPDAKRKSIRGCGIAILAA